jgi:hypothetical protein
VITTGSNGIGRGQTAILVKVKHPETEHSVRVQDFDRWLEAAPRSPAEMSLKNRVALTETYKKADRCPGDDHVADSEWPERCAGICGTNRFTR